jgi:hypothetical protein
MYGMRRYLTQLVKGMAVMAQMLVREVRIGSLRFTLWIRRSLGGENITRSRFGGTMEIYFRVILEGSIGVVVS